MLHSIILRYATKRPILLNVKLGQPNVKRFDEE